MRRVRRREQVARLEAELEKARPYLDLAREIRAEVERVARDDATDVDAIVAAVERIPERERHTVVRAVFQQLPADRQWAILERAFDDDELRTALRDERQRRVDAARHAAVRRNGQLDTTTLAAGERLTLGLFREPDVRDAIDLGCRSTTAARRLVLVPVAGRSDGTLRVIEDVFNPAGGYFVTGDYEHATWADDRLPAHAVVRVGSITNRRAGVVFDPVIHIGGRVDVERDAVPVEGRLHLGYVMVGDDDVFAKGGSI